MFHCTSGFGPSAIPCYNVHCNLKCTVLIRTDSSVPALHIQLHDLPVSDKGHCSSQSYHLLFTQVHIQYLQPQVQLPTFTGTATYSYRCSYLLLQVQLPTPTGTATYSSSRYSYLLFSQVQLTSPTGTATYFYMDSYLLLQVQLPPPLTGTATYSYRGSYLLLHVQYRKLLLL
jgi:hypothetical protein